jgi:ribosomal-protein-alanine N-acetyltransferase
MNAPSAARDTVPFDWRAGLPALGGDLVMLRELRPADAQTLYTELSSPEVKRFIWAPPPSVAAFEKFIEWTPTERIAGKYICYGVVPNGELHACGVFELRQLQPGFLRGELGFAVTHRLWSGGLFVEAAWLLLDFAFRQVRVHRVEARAAVNNERGNAALKALGARREGTLKEAFWQDDRFVDQYLWAFLDSRWATAALRRPPR